MLNCFFFEQGYTFKKEKNWVSHTNLNLDHFIINSISNEQNKSNIPPEKINSTSRFQIECMIRFD